MKKILVVVELAIAACFSSPFAYAAGVNGDAQINGMFDGSPIVIKTTDRDAGAIASLTWKGVEFVDDNDHGRQLQYAWNINNQRECNNPTEAGTANDGSGSTSSSVLLSIEAAGNRLTTVNRPAFWWPPLTPHPTNICQYSVNTTIVSNYTLKKVVTIGWQDMPNVVEFLATVSVPEQIIAMAGEWPTGYLPNPPFSQFLTYDPRTRKLTNQKLTNNEFVGGYLPVAISTQDGKYAVGAYSPDLPNENQGDRIYSLFTFSYAPTSKWNVSYRRGYTLPGDYFYHTYMAIGTLDQVVNSIDSLYQRMPMELEVNEGYLDKANCQDIAGWSGTVGEGKTPGSVSLFVDGNNNSGVGIGNIKANIKRESEVCWILRAGPCEPCPADLPQCQHGFSLNTPVILKDGKSHTLFAYGITPSGSYRLLNNSPKTIRCSTEISVIRQLINTFNSIFDYNQLIANFGK
ncbi:MAG: hypothetical protein V1858_02225 [Candidatus Gottesmanbacteria bacterium]